MKKIGFIGVGIMGKSMVRNLKKAGFDLHIYARTKAKVEDVIAEGVTFHDSIADCVKDCEAVITIVGFPQDVEEVYFDQGNILDSAKEGAYLIDMTTTSPQIAQKIYEEGNKRGFHVLDAPVTGGDTGAKAGTLSILVGGDKEDFEACMPLFEAMGTNINYQGAAGCGQHCKLANQIMIAGALSGLGGALLYLANSGKYMQVLDVIAPEGFSGISVALLGLSNPIGILFAGLFIGYITVGGNNMQLFDFAPEVIDIIIAAIIYCGALSLLFKNTIYKFQMRKAKKAEKKSGTDRAGKEGQS